MASKICNKSYVDMHGEVSKHAHDSAIAVRFAFANGNTHDVERASFNQTVQDCFLLNGMSQKLGDKFAGSAGPDEAEDMFLDLLESLSGDDGTWIKVGERAGPRTTVLAEALHRAKSDKYPSVEAAATAVSGWDADKRKAASVPLEPFILQIKAERATAKAAAASGKETDISDL